jgi:hypothetical protein
MEVMVFMSRSLAGCKGIAASCVPLLPCPAMKSVYVTRRENLRSLMAQWGGPTSMAKKLGHTNGSYIAQLAGPNPSREVSEKVARDMEAKLGLPIGWLDQEHAGNGRQVDDETLSACVRAVAAAIRDAGLKPDPDAYANLVGLVYEHTKLTGRVDEPFIQKLIGLIR